MYLNLLLLAVFFAAIAFLVNGGLWTNTLVLINVVTAALIATNYFEPLANWLESLDKSYTYFCDFLSLWLLFAAAMGCMRALTDVISKVKVKFKRPVDQVGGILMACWVGWMMVCFTTMTLHTAPLARNFMNGAFQPKPDSNMFFGLAPDRRWLGFMWSSSRSSFSRSAPKNDPQQFIFDPHRSFVFKYGQRRADFEKELESRVLR
jgi:hypothetical protein